MINVLIPMAGSGSRFSAAGFLKPKPFIDVLGKPMIRHVIENLAIPDARYILVAQRDHLHKEQKLVNEIQKSHNTIFIPVDKLTEGTACTVLYARKFINNNVPLLIANSDQIVDFDAQTFVENCKTRQLDGSILAFHDLSRNPKWSFVRIESDELAVEVKEKHPISDLATVGIYLFSKGSDFVDAAIEMILNRDKTNNEYYTCPVYNYLIKDGKKIGVYKISSKEMHGLGTPEDLSLYLELNKFRDKNKGK